MLYSSHRPITVTSLFRCDNNTVGTAEAPACEESHCLPYICYVRYYQTDLVEALQYHHCDQHALLLGNQIGYDSSMIIKRRASNIPSLGLRQSKETNPAIAAKVWFSAGIGLGTLNQTTDFENGLGFNYRRQMDERCLKTPAGEALQSRVMNKTFQ